MDVIAERLKIYIDTHPIDLGAGDCKTVEVSILHGNPLFKETFV